jgi:glutamate synthase domain-containing protein 3
VSAASPAVVPVDEIRDYHRINAEITRLLNLGHVHLRLGGVGGQRLLLAGLSGPWEAAVEVVGAAGPELAADLDSPGLVVLAHGAAADGAGRGLRAGTLWVRGRAGDGLAYGQRGGVVAAVGPAGHRAGLAMQGGLLLLLGGAGRLAGERQAGGLVVARAGLGPDAGHARRGGRLVGPGEPIEDEVASTLHGALGPLRAWADFDV